MDAELLTYLLDQCKLHKEGGSQWPLLLLFFVNVPMVPCCVGITDERVTITVPLESFHEVILLFLQVLTLLYNAPGVVMKTVRPQVQENVCVCLYSDIEFTICLLC